MRDTAWSFLRRGSQVLARRRLELTVEGTGHLPASGPVIIAARHYHHLYDGVALLATVPRPLHILVGLDWATNSGSKAAMTALCRAARWPVVLRQDGAKPVDPAEMRAELRRATAEAMTLLGEGRVLVVFPEAYPNVDPGHTPKVDAADFLPFRPGVVRLAALATARGLCVPIVPAGFWYEHADRWRVHLRFGEPLLVSHRRDEPRILADLEARVRVLSSSCPDLG